MTSAATLPLSVEFFPPNTPVGSEKLKTVVKELSVLKPEFFSVTYGAGGSTREKTLATVRDIAAAGHEAAPHLSCVGSTRESIAEILATYRAQGIRRQDQGVRPVAPHRVERRRELGRLADVEHAQLHPDLGSRRLRRVENGGRGRVGPVRQDRDPLRPRLRRPTAVPRPARVRCRPTREPLPCLPPSPRPACGAGRC